jgi:hypothetical protein
MKGKYPDFSGIYAKSGVLRLGQRRGLRAETKKAQKSAS